MDFRINRQQHYEVVLEGQTISDLPLFVFTLKQLLILLCLLEWQQSPSYSSLDEQLTCVKSRLMALGQFPSVAPHPIWYIRPNFSICTSF